MTTKEHDAMLTEMAFAKLIRERVPEVAPYAERIRVISNPDGTIGLEVDDVPDDIMQKVLACLGGDAAKPAIIR